MTNSVPALADVLVVPTVVDDLMVLGGLTVLGVRRGVAPALTGRFVMANDLRTTAICCRA